MDNKKRYNTYDDIDDRYIERWIEKERADFDHQWRMYTSDDSDIYEQRECLKGILREGLIF